MERTNVLASSPFSLLLLLLGCGIPWKKKRRRRHIILGGKKEEGFETVVRRRLGGGGGGGGNNILYMGTQIAIKLKAMHVKCL